MEAKTKLLVNTKLLIRDILSNDSFQLMIPVYQRNYSWTEEYYGELLDDLCDSYEDMQKNYFLGTFILRKQKTSSTILQNRFWIIDGQQRITTIYVLVFAVLKVFNQDEIISKWCNNVLFNHVDDENKKAKLKLKLIKTDDKVLNSFILAESSKDAPIEENDEATNDDEIEESNEYKGNSRLAKVFTYFVNQIREHFHCENPRISINDFVFKVLENIQVVEIDVDERGENEQLIFDRINASGELLSIVDLIRNFLMTGYKTYQPMKQVYDAKWVPFEQLFCDNKDELKKFMNVYLIAKFYSTPKFAQSRKVSYTLFKKWYYQEVEKKYSNEIEAKQFVLDDLNKFAKYYLTITAQSVILNEMISPYLIALFKYFSLLKTPVGLPFLLLMFDDFANQKVNLANFEYATHFILDYLIRLYVCHLDTRELDVIFSQFYLDLKDNLEDYDNNFEAALKACIHNSSKYNFPTDEMFHRHLEDDELTEKLAKTILAIGNYGIKPLLNDLKKLEELPLCCINIFEFARNSHYFHDMRTIGNFTLAPYSSIEDLDYEHKFNELKNSEFSKLIASLPEPSNIANDEKQFISIIKNRCHYLWPTILQNLPDFVHHQDNQNEGDNNSQNVPLPD